jgi:hypothetical protein
MLFAQDSQVLLSFSTPWGTFPYQVEPQGLISSAAWFQNAPVPLPFDTKI